MESVAVKRDFGWGNLALIVALAAVLTYSAVRQTQSVNYLAQNNSAGSSYTLSPQFADNTVIGDAGTDTNSDQNNTTEFASANTPTQAAVLGASTYNKDFVDQLNISVPTTTDNSSVAMQIYAQQVSVLLKADQVAPGKTLQEKKFLNDAQQLTVPSNIADYQKLLIGYYAISYSKDAGQGDSNTGQYLSQLKAELDAARSDFNGAFNLNLP